MGCCSACGGTGSSNDAESNGRCWDCRGTGHAHAPLPLHRTEAGTARCSTCDGGGCYDCTDPA